MISLDCFYFYNRKQEKIPVQKEGDGVFRILFRQAELFFNFYNPESFVMKLKGKVVLDFDLVQNMNYYLALNQRMAFMNEEEKDEFLQKLNINPIWRDFAKTGKIPWKRSDVQINFSFEREIEKKISSSEFPQHMLFLFFGRSDVNFGDGCSLLEFFEFLFEKPGFSKFLYKFPHPVKKSSVLLFLWKMSYFFKNCGLNKIFGLYQGGYNIDVLIQSKLAFYFDQNHYFSMNAFTGDKRNQSSLTELQKVQLRDLKIYSFVAKYREKILNEVCSEKEDLLKNLKTLIDEGVYLGSNLSALERKNEILQIFSEEEFVRENHFIKFLSPRELLTFFKMLILEPDDFEKMVFSPEKLFPSFKTTSVKIKKPTLELGAQVSYASEPINSGKPEKIYNLPKVIVNFFFREQNPGPASLRLYEVLERWFVFKKNPEFKNLPGEIEIIDAYKMASGLKPKREVTDDFFHFLDARTRYFPGNRGDASLSHFSISKTMALVEHFHYNFKHLIYYYYDCCAFRQGITSAQSCSELLMDYRISMKELKSNRVEKYPKSLKLAHDVASYRLSMLRDAQLEKNFSNAVSKESYHSFCDENIRVKLESFSILSPESISDIVFEGSQLNHCVGSYTERIISDSCRVYFLRKNEEKEKPWVTIAVSPYSENLYSISMVKQKLNLDPPKNAVMAILKWAKEKELKITDYYIRNFISRNLELRKEYENLL